MRRKHLLIILVAIGIFLGYVAFSGTLRSRPDSSGAKIKVTASFYPMAEFARQVGGDRVEVTTLIAPGVEPHDYDPSPQDLATLQTSSLFVYNGAGLETWAARVVGDMRARGGVAVEASSGLPLKAAASGSENAGHDPHVWLDPVLASREVDQIATGLVRADPAGRTIYQANAAAFKSQLADLDAAYRAGLQTCARRDIVTSHQAFAYLGARYGLNVMPIAGLAPDEEPSPQKLAQITQFVRQNDVRYIFFESLASPKLSDTIARETGAKTLVFNPLEGLTDAERAQGQNYLTVQRQNLANLRIALDCK